ncbi:MAG: helix-turn-helix transcriptional regulator, partial [Actinomycetota bacterium]|nr:helix-turn-helix transcriptional regulator [Actinomycetota bacterium]
ARALGEAELDRRAWHLSQAALEPDATVAAVLEHAAESALERGAFAVSASRFERSARLSTMAGDRVQRLTRAGETSWLGGQSERAAALLDEAARSAADQPHRAHAMALQGVVTARAGALDEARDLLLSAADAQADDPDAATLVLAEAVYTCFYLGDGRTAVDVVRRLDELEPRVRSERARLLCDLASGMGLIMVGQGDEGVPRLRRGLGAAADGHLSGDPRWLPWLLLGPIWLRESGEARRRLAADMVREARERVAVGTLPFLLFHAARDDATTDRWAAAEAGFREAVALAGETGLRTDAAISLAGLAWLMARQGREADARATEEEARHACDRSRLHLGRAWLGYALGDLEAGLGNPAEALRHYRAQQGLVAGLGLVDPDLSPSAEVVECLVRLGQQEDAVREARAFEAAATAKGQPWARARAHRALAVAGIEPAVHFGRALAQHAHTPDAFELARTELALGAHLRRDRRPSEARPHLRAALTAFDRLAARPWAEAASLELTATGERVQRRTGIAAQQLTPQEFQTARLLAEGATTREAAAALFLSPKTVEYHLRHVYIKLGISSRRELAERVAADPELRPPR